jgi:hypothetical protein
LNVRSFREFADAFDFELGLILQGFDPWRVHHPVTQWWHIFWRTA